MTAKVPLVLLPGTLCDSELWSHQVTNLSDIADVQIGVITKHSTIEEIAADVLRKAPPQFALAGLSLGGIVAIEMMRQAPDRILKLALVNTTANPPFEQQQKQWAATMKDVEEGKFIEVVQEQFIPNLFYKDHPKKKALQSKAMGMAVRVGEASYLNQLKAVASKPDGFEVLPTIACDTLFVVGREDALCTVEIHEKMHTIIPHSRLVIAEECGHLSPMEQPEFVTGAMREWLTNV